jgi:hypothetical protein
MSGDWFNLNSIVDLQKGLIYDLSGNRKDASVLAINNVALNLDKLGNTITKSSVLPTLTYQNEVNQILERENARLAERKQAIEAAEMGQKRLVDLTTSATLRNKALNKIYVVITIAVLIYLGIRLMINSGRVPEIVTDLMFIFLVTGTTITLVNMYYDYNRRNNMDYNMINLGEPKQLSGSASDSKSGSANLLESRFNGCVKEACCPEGSTFNDKFSICVPDLPPNDGKTQPGFKYFIASKSWEDPVSKCVSLDKYSFPDLACKGNTVAAFTTIAATSDIAKPNAPTEFVDYNLYK